MKNKLFITFLSLILVSCSASPSISIVNSLTGLDTTPPVLKETVATSLNDFSLTFSENVKLKNIKLKGNEILESSIINNKLFFKTKDIVSISQGVDAEITVSDHNGNLSHYKLQLFGKNTNLPSLKINEVLSRGTDTQPERIELEVQSNGNTEGVYITLNTKNYSDNGFSLPNINVKRGEYILIYWNTIPNTEVNISNCHVIYAKQTSSLPSNNGVIVIYDSKLGKGEILDALCYSDFNSTTHGGFGNKAVYDSYLELLDEVEWFEEPFNCSNMTSTRTMCRYTNKKDSNTSFDFYICDTRNSSFGTANNNKEYLP